MFEVKNSINWGQVTEFDWSMARSEYGDNEDMFYYDNENYSRILLFRGDHHKLDTIPEHLDTLFGGDWILIDQDSFKMLETHYEALNRVNPIDDVNIWANKTLNDVVKQQRINSGGLKEVFNRHLNSLPDIKLRYNPCEVKFDGPILNSFPEHLRMFQSEFYNLLVVKNRAYGNSALQPINTFSKASSSDVILQQIDHKLSRIKNSDVPTKNNVIDLMGYLTLYCLDQAWLDLSDLHN